MPLLLRMAGAFAYAPQAFGTRWALAFWLGRAVGRRPNHCYNRCNRTNKTACRYRLGAFCLHGARTRADRPHACMRPSRPSCSPQARLSGATGDRASSSTLDRALAKQQQDVALQRLNSKLDLQQSSTVAYDAPRKAHISKFASQRSYAEM